MSDDQLADRVVSTLRRLDAWGGARDWVGPDPYEGLNAERAPFAPRNAFSRRLLIQLVKRSPIDLRRSLRIEPRPNAATLAHVLAASARMRRLGLLPGDHGTERIGLLVRRLGALRVGGFTEPCWGYPFDVETRFFFYGVDTPNTIATAFAGLALLETGDDDADRSQASRMAEGAGEFFLRHVPQTPAGEGAFFGYLPADTTPIHNANLLACALLAALARRTGRADFERAARAGVAYSVECQRADGSWPYAEDPRADWIDGHHTGYVLDSLLLCARCLDDRAAEEAYLRGLKFYSRRLFAADHAPKSFADQLYPIDGLCLAQAIRTFSVASAVDIAWLEHAWSVYEFALERMRRADGAFFFQRRRMWVNRTPHVRWVQAPMLDALSVFYEVASSKAEGPRVVLPCSGPAKVS